MKIIVIPVLAAIVLAVGGWFGYQQYTAFELRKTEQTRRAAQQAAVAAKQQAFQVAAEAERKKQIAAALVTRREVEGALKPLRVTSILPGNPGLAIINKTEYAEGDSLTLTTGKRLLIASIRADGVALAGNGQTYHLDPPPEPDLEASHKGK
jgi:hypothetical protein